MGEIKTVGDICSEVGAVSSPLRHATARLLAAMDARAGTAVAFHLPTIRTVASDEQVRGMYFLPEEIDLDSIEAIAMAPGGTAFLRRDGRVQLPPQCPEACAHSPTLFEVHAPDFRWLGHLGALCIGVGRLEPLPPVTLALNFEDGFARGATLFSSPPCGKALELLAAIGVRLLGERFLTDGRVLVRLENRLAAHFDAAALSQYRRTLNCNLFFLSHGNATGEIEEGLEAASRVRIAAGRARLAQAVIDLSNEALEKRLSLRMRAPGTRETEPYGDLVPMGFLGMALRRIADQGGPLADAAAQRLLQVQAYLRMHQTAGLWGYARNCIPTSTDTALVCLAGLFPNFEVLERLRGTDGGFRPQWVTEKGGPFSMKRSPATRHWEEEDVPTTAFLEALRLDAGLEAKTDAKWFLDRSARWGGLFFTPPTLGLWALARIAARLALEQSGGHRPRHSRVDEKQTHDPYSALLCGTIRETLARLRNIEGGFGRFDPVLHNSFAVLAIEELGLLDRTTAVAQLRLLDAWEAPRGVETPFYSTLLFASPQAVGDDSLRNSRPGSDSPSWRQHQVTLYEDPSRLIVTAVAALALQVEADPGVKGDFRSLPGESGGTLRAEIQSLSSPMEQSLHHVQFYCGPPANYGQMNEGRQVPLSRCGD
jgi:hypothetical protein